MWTCMIHTMASPIRAWAIAGGIFRRLNAGTASKNPRKKTMAAGST